MIYIVKNLILLRIDNTIFGILKGQERNVDPEFFYIKIFCDILKFFLTGKNKMYIKKRHHKNVQSTQEVYKNANNLNKKYYKLKTSLDGFITNSQDQLCYVSIGTMNK